MSTRLFVLGGAGDFATRRLMPALADLEARRALAPELIVTAASRRERTDEEFRRGLLDGLDVHAPGVDPRACEALVARCSFRSADATDPAAVAALLERGAGPALVYLALPSDVVADAAATLAQVGLPEGSRVAVERPIGRDLASATRVEEVLGAFDPGVVLRVDHFLGLRAVLDLVRRRVEDPHLDDVLGRGHVARVELTWEERCGLEGCANCYREHGALRDLIQSHLLQLMALVAMDRPECADDAVLRHAKLALLASVRMPDVERAAASVVRARYEAGEIGGRPVPAYAEEEGVDPKRETESFAEVTLYVDSPRWSTVPFVLRAGIALGEGRKEIRVVFHDEREVAHVEGIAGSALVVPIADAEPGGDTLPAYAEVVRTALAGDADLALGGAEVLAAWAIVDPYLRAFDEGAVPMSTYAPGSPGPSLRGRPTRAGRPLPARPSSSR